MIPKIDRLMSDLCDEIDCLTTENSLLRRQRDVALSNYQGLKLYLAEQAGKGTGPFTDYSVKINYGAVTPYTKRAVVAQV